MGSIAIAINGFPPIAYTSLKALVAAILPKVKGRLLWQEKISSTYDFRSISRSVHL
jgi:hypothetical protein